MIFMRNKIGSLMFDFVYWFFFCVRFFFFSIKLVILIFDNNVGF